MWNDIVADMAPYHPIQRGYGGAKWSDIAVFAERLIRPHNFRAIVFFVANDISGQLDDKSPEEVARLFAYVLGKVREHHTLASVFFHEASGSRGKGMMTTPHIDGCHFSWHAGRLHIAQRGPE